MANLKKTRPVIALLLSLITPGLGQVYNGKLKRGIVFFLLFEFLFVLLHIFSGLRFKFYGLMWYFASGLGLLGFFLFILLDALFGVNKLRVTVLKPYHKWYFYIVISAVTFVMNEFVLQAILPDIKAFKSYRMSSTSMEPSLFIGDRLIVDRKIYKQVKPKRGELIIFEFPKDPSIDSIKRVMGLEGEKVEIINNKMYINDKLIDDPWGYYKSSDQTKYLRELENFGPAVVPEHSLFILGDNRHNSMDSRLFGFVHFSKVKGKALYIYWAKDKSRIGTSVSTGFNE